MKVTILDIGYLLIVGCYHPTASGWMITSTLEPTFGGNLTLYISLSILWRGVHPEGIHPEGD
jgi:hypothetical protein